MALTGTGAWAQQGGGHGRSPRGGSEPGRSGEHEPRGQREELRALIRHQAPPPREEREQAVERRSHQLSPEERMALREQLRQQRNVNAQRQP